MLNLDAYFERIGYEGPREPTLAVLREIQRLQSCAIPFENLDSFVGKLVRLDSGSIEKKLIDDKRGGYCFELNTLLAEVLALLGFGVTGLAGRVLWGVECNTPQPRTHMMLQVRVNSTPYLVDAGFGVHTPTWPLRLIDAEPQRTPHGLFRLQRDQSEFVLEGRVAKAWKALYRFGLETHTPADYRVYNWYLANHPASVFVSSLIVGRADASCHLSLFNTRFWSRDEEKTLESADIGSAEQLHEILAGEFRLVLPATYDVNLLYTRAAEAQAFATIASRRVVESRTPACGER